jgi:hypothetical protein
MKLLFKKLAPVCLVLAMALGLSSCYETSYYHQYHHHTRDWYGRHHTPPPAGVDFNVDVRN